MKQLYALIGHPLSHSFSKDFFNRKFREENIDAQYLNFEIKDVGELSQLIEDYPNLCGINVTIPHKINVIPLLDKLSDDAETIGAVNVIKIRRKAQEKAVLEGHNSDITGFKQSLKPLLTNNHTQAIILGTGGASKAVEQGLKQLQLTPLYVSRTAKNNCITYEEITKEIIENHTVIVNTTPLGMYPHTEACPDIPYEYLTDNHILYDLIYNPAETLFLQKGKAHKATIKNGLEMLHLQALKAWHIWNLP
ncbi:MAG: shikimate dehydrogenase [Tannerella sp.]|jgi:shikimate dehydrogenase|nr:shikimate dehydrogenase [Tannerella sp.]